MVDVRTLSEMVTLVESRVRNVPLEDGQAKSVLHLTYSYVPGAGQWVWEAEVMVSVAKGLPAVTQSVHRFNHLRVLLEMCAEDPRLDGYFGKD